MKRTVVALFLLVSAPAGAQPVVNMPDPAASLSQAEPNPDMSVALEATGGYMYHGTALINLGELMAEHKVRLHGPTLGASLSVLWNVGGPATKVGLRLDALASPRMWDIDNGAYFEAQMASGRVAATVMGRYLWGAVGVGFNYLHFVQAEGSPAAALGKIDDRVAPELHLSGGVTVPLGEVVALKLGAEFDWEVFNSTYRVGGNAGLRVMF